MIKTKKGATRVNGSEHDIFADLTCIVKTIFEGFKKNMPEDEAKEKIRKAVELALMTNEEFEESFLALIKKRLAEVGELLGDTGEGDANGD